MVEETIRNPCLCFFLLILTFIEVNLVTNLTTKTAKILIDKGFSYSVSSLQ